MIELGHICDAGIAMHDEDREEGFDVIYLPFIAEHSPELGLTSPTFTCVVTLYSAFVNRFKIRSWVSEEWTRTNGEGQGCSLTIVVSNLLL